MVEFQDPPKQGRKLATAAQGKRCKLVRFSNREDMEDIN